MSVIENDIVRTALSAITSTASALIDLPRAFFGNAKGYDFIGFTANDFLYRNLGVKPIKAITIEELKQGYLPNRPLTKEEMLYMKDNIKAIDDNTYKKLAITTYRNLVNNYNNGSFEKAFRDYSTLNAILSDLDNDTKQTLMSQLENDLRLKDPVKFEEFKTASNVMQSIDNLAGNLETATAVLALTGVGSMATKALINRFIPAIATNATNKALNLIAKSSLGTSTLTLTGAFGKRIEEEYKSTGDIGASLTSSIVDLPVLPIGLFSKTEPVKLTSINFSDLKLSSNEIVENVMQHKLIQEKLKDIDVLKISNMIEKFEDKTFNTVLEALPEEFRADFTHLLALDKDLQNLAITRNDYIKEAVETKLLPKLDALKNKSLDVNTLEKELSKDKELDEFFTVIRNNYLENLLIKAPEDTKRIRLSTGNTDVEFSFTEKGMREFIDFVNMYAKETPVMTVQFMNDTGAKTYFLRTHYIPTFDNLIKAEVKVGEDIRTVDIPYTDMFNIEPYIKRVVGEGETFSIQKVYIPVLNLTEKKINNLIKETYEAGKLAEKLTAEETFRNTMKELFGGADIVFKDIEGKLRIDTDKFDLLSFTNIYTQLNKLAEKGDELSKNLVDEIKLTKEEAEGITKYLQNFVNTPYKFDISKVKTHIANLDLPSDLKVKLFKDLEENKEILKQKLIEDLQAQLNKVNAGDLLDKYKKAYNKELDFKEIENLYENQINKINTELKVIEDLSKSLTEKLKFSRDVKEEVIKTLNKYKKDLKSKGIDIEPLINKVKANDIDLNLLKSKLDRLATHKRSRVAYTFKNILEQHKTSYKAKILNEVENSLDKFGLGHYKDIYRDVIEGRITIKGAEKELKNRLTKDLNKINQLKTIHNKFTQKLNSHDLVREVYSFNDVKKDVITKLKYLNGVIKKFHKGFDTSVIKQAIKNVEQNKGDILRLLIKLNEFEDSLANKFLVSKRLQQKLEKPTITKQELKAKLTELIRQAKNPSQMRREGAGLFKDFSFADYYTTAYKLSNLNHRAVNQKLKDIRTIAENIINDKIKASDKVKSNAVIIKNLLDDVLSDNPSNIQKLNKLVGSLYTAFNWGIAISNFIQTTAMATMFYPSYWKVLGKLDIKNLTYEFKKVLSELDNSKSYTIQLNKYNPLGILGIAIHRTAFKKYANLYKEEFEQGTKVLFGSDKVINNVDYIASIIHFDTNLTLPTKIFKEVKIGSITSSLNNILASTVSWHKYILSPFMLGSMIYRHPKRFSKHFGTILGISTAMFLLGGAGATPLLIPVEQGYLLLRGFIDILVGEDLPEWLKEKDIVKATIKYLNTDDVLDSYGKIIMGQVLEDDGSTIKLAETILTGKDILTKYRVISEGGLSMTLDGLPTLTVNLIKRLMQDNPAQDKIYNFINTLTSIPVIANTVNSLAPKIVLGTVREDEKVASDSLAMLSLVAMANTFTGGFADGVKDLYRDIMEGEVEKGAKLPKHGEYFIRKAIEDLRDLDFVLKNPVEYRESLIYLQNFNYDAYKKHLAFIVKQVSNIDKRLVKAKTDAEVLEDLARYYKITDVLYKVYKDTKDETTLQVIQAMLKYMAMKGIDSKEKWDKILELNKSLE